jgi:hypothetical protein
MSTEKAPSGELSTETQRQGTAGTMGELATQNQTGGTAGQTGSGTGTAGQTLPTASAQSSMTATSSSDTLFLLCSIFTLICLQAPVAQRRPANQRLDFEQRQWKDRFS